MGQDVLPDTYRCASCGFYSSLFVVRINSGERIDENIRSRALRPLRLTSFNQLLNDCATFIPQRGNILDVGSAHGWFMAAAKDRGYVCIGIEPDKKIALQSHLEGHDAIIGFFPDAIAPGNSFDAITFNDVFEHLPNPDSVLTAVRKHLRRDGLVTISLPVSSGLIFRLARVGAKIGVEAPLARLWQRGLPSPHLSYFNAINLTTLMERHGFTQERCRPLRSFLIGGLYKRIIYDKELNRTKAFVFYCFALAIALLANFTPADTCCFIFRRKD